MKNIFILATLILVAMCTNIQAQVIFTEDFDGANTSNIPTLTGECVEETGDYFGIVDNTVINVNYNGATGSFLSAQDTDGIAVSGACSAGTGSVAADFSGIDISGCTADLYICFDIADADATDGANDWDANSSISINVTVDGGTTITAANFAGTGTNSAGVANGDIASACTVTGTMMTYCASIPAGSSLDLNISINGMDAGDEDVAVDDILLVCGAANLPTTNQLFEDCTASTCTIDPPVVTNIACDDNDTPTDDTDDIITFDLSVGGTGTATTYTVSGATVTPATAAYDAPPTGALPTSFATGTGAAGAGDLNLILTDDGTASCTAMVVITDPGVCPTPVCSITNVLVTADGACSGDDATYTVCADVAGGSGNYDLVDTDNANAILFSLTGQADGNICFSVTVPGPTATATLNVDVLDNMDVACIGGTPAAVTIPVCPTAAACDLDAAGDIIITEIMYNPCGTDNDEFIEICNTGTAAIDISGWEFYDDATVTPNLQYTVPASTSLAAGDCFATPVGSLNSILNNTGDAVSIVNCNGEVIDVVDYNMIQDGCWDGNNGISMSLIDWMNQDATTNDAAAVWAASANAGVSFSGGSPGVANTYGACLDLSSNITATCNGENAEFTIDYTFANPLLPTVIEVYDGATLLASATTGAAAGTLNYTITGPTAASSPTITVIPQGATIDQTCYDTEVTLNIPECMDSAPELTATKTANDGTDIQYVLPNGDAQFTITLENTGATNICNIVISDPNGADCVLAAAEIDALVAATGDNDMDFEPGEMITYTCMVSGVTTDFTNEISIDYESCDDPGTVLNATDATEVVVLCLIENVAVTQVCTGTDDMYTIEVCFDAYETGATGMFNVYVDAPQTNNPTTVIGTYAYSALAGGCFAVPAADFTGDAVDTEAGIQICVGDADAPAPGSALPPGSTPPPSASSGLPTFDCPQIYGILHNACAPPGDSEGPNEFLILLNGNDPLNPTSFDITTPSGNAYDDFTGTTAPANWICPCCTYVDNTATIPANATVIITTAANTSTLDFTSLCASAGTLYVLQDSGTGSTGHFSNSNPRSTFLNFTSTTGCDTTSYTYVNSDGNDGDYTTFVGPDIVIATGSGTTASDLGTPDPGNINSSGDCTPQVVPSVAEVECFGCTTLNEVLCTDCDISSVIATASACDNATTSPDDTDDTFTFTLDVTQGDVTLTTYTFDGTALGLGTNVPGTYGVAGYTSGNIVIGALAGTTVTLTIVDDVDPTCTATVDVIVPATCSACPDITVVANPVCSAVGTMFDIDYTITGGTGPYTIMEAGLGALTGQAATGTLAGLAYTDQNTKVTLTIEDEGNPGCTVMYEVLQLNCEAQMSEECTCPAATYDINAQATGNGNGFSMVYVLTDASGAIVGTSNNTGIFTGLIGDGNTSYTSYAFNVADAELAAFTADLDATAFDSIMAGDPILDDGTTAPFDVYCYVSAPTTWVRDCMCEVIAECAITNVVATPVCTNNGEEYELCVSFDFMNEGVDDTFDVVVAGTTVGSYTYTAYNAAIMGGATCFTIPLADFAGDATDLEMGVVVDIVDTDASGAGSGLFISAIYPNQVGGGDQNGDGIEDFCDEYIVITNGSGAAIDLSGYSIGDVANSTRHIFPSGTMLAAGASLTIYNSDLSTAPSCGSGVWNNGAETATLYDAASVVVDEIMYTSTTGGMEISFTPVCQGSAMYNEASCVTCLMPTTVMDMPDTVCTGGGTPNLTAWQLDVTNANTTDATTSIQYSSVVVDGVAVTAPDGILPTGNHSASPSCASEDQIAYAYFVCDPDGVVDNGDETITLISTYTLAVYPLPDVTNAVGGACTDMVTDNCGGILDIQYTTDGVMFSTMPPALSPGDADVMVIWTATIVGAPMGCEATGNFMLTCPQFNMPAITVDKNDADDSDDTQEATAAGDATFTITITNTGNEDLCNITLVDTPSDAGLTVTMCEPTFGSVDTDNGGVAAGAGDGILAVGETETYMCTVSGVTADFMNDIAISAEGCTSMTVVNDTDSTFVTVPVAECAITNVVATPVCTNNGEEYELCVSFDSMNEGPDDTFDIVIAGTTVGSYTYTAYNAAIMGGATCFTIPLADFTGDATDLEMGVVVDIVDTDASGAGGSGLFISAIYPNQTGGGDQNGDGIEDFCDEYIVITNGSGAAIDLSGYAIGDVANSTRHIFPSGTMLAAGASLTIYNSDLSTAPSCGSGVWNNGAETATLYDAASAIVDEIMYSSTTGGMEISFVPTSTCEGSAMYNEASCVALAPAITVDKNDADDSDDTQEATAAGDATFTITITNTGNEDLCNITLVDTPSDAGLTVTMCEPTFGSVDTDNGGVAAGTGDGILAVGETETYMCTVNGVTADFRNDIAVSAEGCTSMTVVNDTDSTFVTVPAPVVCEGAFGFTDFSLCATDAPEVISAPAGDEVTAAGDTIAYLVFYATMSGGATVADFDGATFAGDPLADPNSVNFGEFVGGPATIGDLNFQVFNNTTCAPAAFSLAFVAGALTDTDADGVLDTFTPLFDAAGVSCNQVIAYTEYPVLSVSVTDETAPTCEPVVQVLAADNTVCADETDIGDVTCGDAYDFNSLFPFLTEMEVAGGGCDVDLSGTVACDPACNGSFDLALTKTFSTYIDNDMDGVISLGDDAVFTINVFNQGTIDAFDVAVTDYFTAGELIYVSSVLNASSTGTVTDNGVNGFEIDLIPAGMSTAVDVTLTIDPTFAGTNIINNAEITFASESDGGPLAMDEDSTPNDDSGTPAETGTDDDIDDDMNGGMDNPNDSDDYDPAALTLGCPPCPNILGLDRVCDGNMIYVIDADTGTPVADPAAIYTWYILDASGAWQQVAVVTGQPYYSPQIAGTYSVDVSLGAGCPLCVTVGDFSFEVNEIINCKDCGDE